MDCRFLSVASRNTLKLLWILVVLLWPDRLSCSTALAAIRRYADCEDPGAPVNGYRYRDGRGFPVGSSVSFGCRLGYELQGTWSLSCVLDGANPELVGAVWSGDTPHCVVSTLQPHRMKDRTGRHHHLLRRASNCRDNGDPENGFRVLLGGARDGSAVTFGCNEGYALRGRAELTCLQGRWDGTWPLCVEDRAICSDPGTPYLGQRFVAGTMEGATVSYSCGSGFVLEGDAQRTCLDSGQWSGEVPQCRIVNCGRPQTSAHGSVLFNNMGYGFTAEYACNAGHVLEGNREVTCMEDGSWSAEPPTCSAVQCRNLPDPLHGTVTHARSPMYASEAVYSCNTGYGLVGGCTRVCMTDGMWSEQAPTCIRGQCDQLQNPDNGQVHYSSTDIGSRAYYTCFHGYNMHGALERECQASRRWSDTEPTCDPIRCPDITVPRDGQVSQTDGSFVFSDATYTCNVGYLLLGVEERVCRPSGSWSDSAPGCFVIQCSTPTSPHHGSMSLSNRKCYGSEVSYQCDEDYELKFGDRIRTCQESRLWSGTEPCCVPITVMCKVLGNIANGEATVDSRLVGGEVHYSCISGYSLLGASQRTCTADGSWSGSEPSCVLMCETLPNPPFGMVLSTGMGVGAEASYWCVPGYRLSGTGTRTCQENGEWSGNPPVCLLVDCGNLVGPDNGNVMIGMTTLGSEVTYNCDPSFSLRGDESRTCQPDGSWSGEDPVCEEVDCGMLLEPANGAVDMSEGSTVGSEVTYTCDPSFSLRGDESRTCQPDGSWSGEDPVCEEVDCGMLLEPANGAVDMSEGSTVGSEVTYTCDPSFRLRGDESRICQPDGSWSGVDPACEEVDCGMLPEPANGAVVMSEGSTLGSEVTYTCDPSFRLRGDESRTCQPDGSWSGEDPVCEELEVDCGMLPEPANGAVVMSEGSTLGSEVTYTCDPSFRLRGDESRTCQPDGSWSGEDPVCEEVDCGMLPEPANGAVDMSEGSTVGSEVTYTCDPSFRLRGDESRTCQPDGSWSGVDPVCEEVDCGMLLEPANGAVDMSEGSTVGSEVTYTCDPSFSLRGDESRTCQPDGSWSGEDPVCEVTMCLGLEAPEFGGISFEDEDRTVGSNATYSCQSRYTLVGEPGRTCLGTGLWSGQEPTCELIECPPLDDPVNGMVSMEDTTPGSTASYLCSTNYMLAAGSAQRVCQLVGEREAQWSGDDPTCERTTCPSLEAPENGGVVFTPLPMPFHHVGSMAIYSCDNGYEADGGSTVRRVCGADGAWNGMAPTCVLFRVSCPLDLDDPEFGSVEIQGDGKEGSLAVYSCDRGYEVVGEAERVCEMVGMAGREGAWSGEEPTCQRVMCPTLEPPLDGSVRINSPLVNGTALYFCKSGFMRNGSTSRRCDSTGKWTGSAPVCDPKPETVSCGGLEPPEKGTIDITSTTPSSTATYSCMLGYMLLGGDSERRCLDNGTWSGTKPSCVAVDCGPLSDPTNGVVLVSVNTTLGMTARYECNSGYQLSGLADEIRFCTVTGDWSETEPTCELVDCGMLSPPLNGVVDQQQGTKFTAVAFYSCREGYVLTPSEPQSRTCTDTGEWSDSNLTLTCELVRESTIDCGDLPSPSNGQRTLLNSSTAPGSLAEYSCRSGYMLVGVATRRCQDNGQWDGAEPECVERRCPMLSAPENGRIFIFGTKVGSSVSYVCNSGYIRVGLLRRMCQENGEWTGEDPLCLRIENVMCPSLTSPTNGSAMVEGLSVGSMVDYSCDDGFTVEGPTSRSCQSNGEWTGVQPTCERVQCPDPGSLADGQRFGDSFQVDEVVLFQCFDPFALDGESVLTCQEDGTWNHATPTCTQRSATGSRRSRRGSCSGVGVEVLDDLGERCRCVLGRLESCCRYRQEWTQLTPDQQLRYIAAVKTAASDPRYRPIYLSIMQLYRDSFDAVVLNTDWSSSQFFPWHRYYLQLYEDLLRVVDGSVTVPYWDWTVSPAKPYDSPVFDTELGFGNSADNLTSFCVNSGPFQRGEFSVAPSAGGGCVRRTYGEFGFPNRQFLDTTLSLPANSFSEFHQTLQLFVHFNIRCFVGGTMCTNFASNDPLYLLLLARLDHLLDHWQGLDGERAVAGYTTNSAPLFATLREESELKVSDYSRNKNLPHGTSVCYSELPDTLPSSIADPE